MSEELDQLKDLKKDLIDALTKLDIEFIELKADKTYLLDVMEAMIPLTVCDEELKNQWKKLIAKRR